MNRDESRQRPTANAPELVIRGGCLALYPTEPGGGSWVGVNDTGLALALINWYAIPRAADIGRVSRGAVVPLLLATKRIEEVRTAIAALPKHEMAPFRLLAFALRERRAFEFRWDQRTLEDKLHAWEPRHWFSSGCDEPRAQHERSKIAREAWQKARAGSRPWLRQLHASHAPACGPFCFCMHRKDAATVSFTELVVTSKAAAMRYHDGPLCMAPQPKTIHNIFLQSPCKEFALSPTNQQPGDHHENQQSALQSPRRSLLSRGLSSCGDLLEVAR